MSYDSEVTWGVVSYDRFSFTSQRYYFKKDLADSKGQLLPERYKKVFMNKQIVGRLFPLEDVLNSEQVPRFVWSTKRSLLKTKERSSRFVYAFHAE